MNERIKILLKQATITRYSGYAWSDEVDQQQFAELIIKECIKAYNDDGYQTEYEQDLKVLKHFGVAE